MTSCVLNPTRLRGEPLLPATGILAVNPSDSRVLATVASEAGLQRHYLFNSTLFSSEDFFVAGPAVGAPMAVMCLEKLIVLGAKRILLYGWCGSLQPELRAMDILVPTSSHSEEGTSCHYSLAEDQSSDYDCSLRREICLMLEKKDISYQNGSVWTTDAPYRETLDKVNHYAGLGVCGVDMEYSALKRVAMFRQVELAAVLLVSDELSRLPWKPQYRFKTFKNASGKLLEQLCGFAAHANHSMTKSVAATGC